MRRDPSPLWLCLLPPELIERLEQQDDFSEPHPDFPDRHAMYYKCSNCNHVHWQIVYLRLDSVAGELMVGHYRDRIAELEHMKRVDASPKVVQYLTAQAAKEDITYLGHEATEGVTPEAFRKSYQADVDKGVLMYLREIKATGKDPYFYFQERPSSRGGLKLLANAELLRRESDPLLPLPVRSIRA